MARPRGAARRFVVVAVVALAVVLPGASAYFRERFWHQVRKLTGSACPWRKDAGQELHRLLNNRIGGQIGAVEQLVDAVERWTVSVQSAGSGGRPAGGPMVLFLSGVTGSGKTTAAGLVARSLLEASVPPQHRSDPLVPEGLLQLNGEVFTEAGGGTPESLRQQVAALSARCSGRGVVVFDEFQKADPAAVSAVLELINGTPPAAASSEAAPGSEPAPVSAATAEAETAPAAGAPSPPASAPASTDVRGLVFLFLVDLLSEDANRIITQAAAKEPTIEQHLFTVEVDGNTIPRGVGVREATARRVEREIAGGIQRELEGRWPSFSLGSAMRHTVSFLPFTEEATERVVAIHLRAAVALLESLPEGSGLHRVEPSKELLAMFSSSTFVSYTGRRTRGQDGSVVVVMLAEDGARQVSEHRDAPIRRLVRELRGLAERRQAFWDKQQEYLQDPTQRRLAQASAKSSVVARVTPHGTLHNAIRIVLVRGGIVDAELDVQLDQPEAEGQAP
ncbi:hypothetical protein FNF28_03848 [Cafeteria roenbergensis]|uniref:AAA+ ATPase domain-containing protein n=1 Tax=Cafeteria roenbergensis TaxID=33653 RepID=A0A5A8DIQ9_CAFRO|nr:hypothetical protein FNF28_03848 [Cafeteria roenbergensis]